MKKSALHSNLTILAAYPMLKEVLWPDYCYSGCRRLHPRLRKNNSPNSHR